MYTFQNVSTTLSAISNNIQNSTLLKRKGKTTREEEKHRAALTPDRAEGSRRSAKSETLRVQHDLSLPLAWDQAPFIGHRMQNSGHHETQLLNHEALHNFNVLDLSK